MMGIDPLMKQLFSDAEPKLPGAVAPSPRPVDERLKELDKEFEKRQQRRMGRALADSDERVQLVTEQNKDGESLGMLGEIVERVAQSRGAGDPATFREAADLFEQQGIRAGQAIITDTFHNEVTRVAADRSMRLFSALGFDKINGMDKEKGQLHAAMQATSLLAHAPLKPADETLVAGETMRQLVQQRISQIADQPQTEETQTEIERLTDVAKSLIDNTPDELWLDVTQAGFHMAHRRPRNPHEAAIAEWIENKGKEAMLDEGRIRFDIKGARVEKISAEVPRLEVQTALNDVLGPNWPTAVSDRMDDARFRFQLGQLGWGVGPDGQARPATSLNGVNLVDVLPRGPYQALLEASAARAKVEELVPVDMQEQVRSEAETIEATQGKEVAQLALRRFYGEILAQRGQDVGAHILEKPPADTVFSMTPFERDQAGNFALLQDAADIIIRMTADLEQGIREVNERIFTLPALREMTQGMAYKFTGDEKIAEATQTASEFISLFFKVGLDDPSFILERIVNPQLFGVGTETELAPPNESLQRFQALANTDPKTFRDLVFNADRFNETWEQDWWNLDVAQERQVRVSRALSGLDPFTLSTVWDMSAAFAHQAGALLFEPIRLMYDSPEKAFLWIAGNEIGAQSLRALKSTRKGAFGRVMTPWRLREKYLEIRNFNPELLEPINKAVRKKLDSITPDNHPRVEAELRQLEGLIDSELTDAKVGRFRSGRKASKLFARQFDGLSDQLGEVHEYIVQAIAEQTGLLSTYRTLRNNLLGQVRKPGKMWDVVTSETVFNEVESAVDRILRGGDEFGSQEYWGKYKDFVAKQGREPDLTEALQMLPDRNYTLENIVAATERTPVREHSGFWGMIARLMGIREPGRLQAAISVGQEALNQATEMAMDIGHSTHSFNIFKARMNKVLDVVKFSTRNKLNELKILDEGLNAMVDNTPKGRPVDPDITRILNEIKQETPQLQLKLNRINKVVERMDVHDPTKRFVISDEMVNLQNEVSPATWDLLVQTNPTLFNGMTREALFNSVVSPNPRRAKLIKQELPALKRRVSREVGRIREARQDPLGNDSVLDGLQESRARLGRQRRAVQDLPGKPFSTARWDQLRSGHPALDVAWPETFTRGVKEMSEMVSRVNDVLRLANTMPSRAPKALKFRTLAPFMTDTEAAEITAFFNRTARGQPFEAWADSLVQSPVSKVPTRIRPALVGSHDRLLKVIHEIDPSAPIFTGRQRPVSILKEVDSYVTALRTADAAGIEERLGQVSNAARSRVDGLKDGSIQSRGEIQARGKLAGLRREWHAKMRQIEDALDPAPELVFDRDGHRRLRAMLEHAGVNDRDTLRKMQDFRTQLRASKALGFRSSPFGLRGLPVHFKAKAMRDMQRSALDRIAMWETKIEDFAGEIEQLSKAQRKILGSAQRRGTMPSTLLRTNPARWKRVLGLEPDDPVLGHLDDLFKAEGKLWSDMLENFREVGFVDEAFYQQLKKQGYDPRFFGAHERAKLVVDADARRVGDKVGRAETKADAQVRSLDPLKQRRDIDKWRVRVSEPDRVIDKLFSNRERAEAWLKQTYGDDVLSGATKGDPFTSGRTPFDDDFTIAKPLGRDAFEALDFLKEGTSEFRLRRLQQMARDFYLHSYIEALNLHGGLVLSPDEFFKLRDQVPGAGRENRFAGQYVPIPDQPKFFGSLSGKYLHKKVLREMEAAGRGYDELSALMEGLRENFNNVLAPRTPIEAALNRSLPTLLRSSDVLNSVAKSSLILWNWGTWVGNHVFNFTLDKLVGSRVANLENIDTLRFAIEQTTPKGPGVLGRSPLWLDFVEDGLGSGTLFSRQNSRLRRLLLDTTGLSGKTGKQLEGLVRKRQVARQKFERAFTEGKTSADDMLMLQKEVAALNAALKRAQTGRLRRWGRKIAGFWANEGDELGLPANEFQSLMKAYYNQVDEMWKFAAYTNLRKQGLSRQMAAWKIRTFFQDYSRVPTALTQLGPLTSLVVSFPWELSRLSWNHLRYNPARVMGMLSMIPAINMVSMARAGVNPDRLAAILETRGSKGSVEHVAKFMSNILLFDRGGDLVTQADVTNIFPFTDIIAMRGLLGGIFEQMSPPETRGPFASAVALPVGWASSMVGNNVGLNMLLTMWSGRDPFTKRRLYEEDAPILTRTKQLLKAMSKTFVPPVFPYIGREGERVTTSLDAPINPRTGRLRRAQETITPLIKILTNVAIRGVPGPGVGRVGEERKISTDLDIIRQSIIEAMPQAGLSPAKDFADNSIYNDLADLYARMVDETFDPEDRERAEAEFETLARARVERYFGPITLPREHRTIRQLEKFVQKLEENDDAGRFAGLPIDMQAALLASWDRQQVSDANIEEMMAAMLFTENLDRSREADPELVRRAINVLEKEVARPTHNQRFDKLLDYLKKIVLPRSLSHFNREKRRDELKKKYRELRLDQRVRVLRSSVLGQKKLLGE